MTLTGIIIIIVLGLIFMLIEVLIIPGVGVVGITGGILMCIGVYYAYVSDTTTGHIALACTAASSIGLLLLSLRAKTWNRLMLKDKIDSKIHNVISDIKAGDKGIAITRLNPMGKARINDQLVEVKSYSAFINENTPLIVIDVEKNQITVKPE